MEVGTRRRGPKPKMDTVSGEDTIRISREIKIPQRTDVVMAEGVSVTPGEDKDGAHVYKVSANILVYHPEVRALEEIFLVLARRIWEQEDAE
jgi:hypothetical protein